MQCSNGIARKTEKKNIFFFLFPQPIVFLFTACSQNTPVHARTCVCAVCSAEGRDIPTLATTAGTKNEIHSCICHARLVPICVKQILPSRTSAGCSLPTNRSTHAVASTVQLLPAPWRSYCVPLIVNKSLGHTSPIGPLLVSCLIHCRSPTPSAILLRLTELRSSSVWRSSSA